MAGLGLTQALGNFQQGMAWRDNQTEMQRQKDQRAKIESANAAGAKVVKDAQAAHEADQAAQLEAWTKGGKTADEFQAKPFTPDDGVMFRAAHARGNALLGAGEFDAWAENRAKIIPMQVRARQEAWQRYQTDGDIGALGKAMYDTIPDGKHVKAYDKLSGPGPDGLQTAGDRIRFQLDDGTTKLYRPQEIEAMAKKAMEDPVATAKREFELDLYRAKMNLEGEKEQSVATHKHGLTMAEIKARGDVQQVIADKRGDVALKVADTRANSAERVAETRAGATTTAAGLRSAGGGGKPGTSGSSVQSKYTDDEGYVRILRRDGTTERLMDGGKPIKSGDYSKRVDSLAASLGKNLNNMDKSPADLRRMAEEALASNATPKRPGLESFSTTTPGAKKPPLSQFKVN